GAIVGGDSTVDSAEVFRLPISRPFAHYNLLEANENTLLLRRHIQGNLQCIAIEVGTRVAPLRETLRVEPLPIPMEQRGDRYMTLFTEVMLSEPKLQPWGTGNANHLTEGSNGGSSRTFQAIVHAGGHCIILRVIRDRRLLGHDFRSQGEHQDERYGF